ncbi:hypothetical protein GGI35DRAFT_58734 [Trichoderma velutinum]
MPSSPPRRIPKTSFLSIRFQIVIRHAWQTPPCLFDPLLVCCIPIILCHLLIIWGASHTAADFVVYARTPLIKLVRTGPPQNVVTRLPSMGPHPCLSDFQDFDSGQGIISEDETESQDITETKSSRWAAPLITESPFSSRALRGAVKLIS